MKSKTFRIATVIFIFIIFMEILAALIAVGTENFWENFLGINSIYAIIAFLWMFALLLDYYIKKI